MPKRTFVLTITTDYEDGEMSARIAAEKAACQVGWGDDNTSSIELTEITGTDHPTHLTRWDFEPGSQSDDELNADERKAFLLIDGDERLASFAATCGSDDLEERLADEIERNDLDISVGRIDFVKLMNYFQNT
jgi:hypothetical protein